jgi:hypothetical protein
MAAKKAAAALIVCAAFCGVEASAADTNTISSTVIDKSVPAAIAPSAVINNSDVCVTTSSAGATTSVFGISGATSFRDKNCEAIKLFRLLYGGGMKVAAISLICQDARVFDAMWSAGTPCPANEGLIGDAAKAYWKEHPTEAPEGTRIRVAAEAKEITHHEAEEPQWHGD